MSKRKEISTALLGVVVALVLWVTILSRETLVGTPISYLPFHALGSFLKELRRGIVDANFLGNIILFMPFSFLLSMASEWERLWKVASFGIGFSLLIEVIQFLTRRGCFDPDDVLLNAVGTMIGFGLYSAIRKLFTKNDL